MWSVALLFGNTLTRAGFVDLVDDQAARYVSRAPVIIFTTIARTCGVLRPYQHLADRAASGARLNGAPARVFGPGRVSAYLMPSRSFRYSSALRENFVNYERLAMGNMFFPM